ncbi:MAG: MarC family NAAT transporter [Candidatus Dadabacteria bacterium]|jgi:multiple antibiotic resistance protein|nr:MarC family NAAT transporter [Candidatus Dadabacteria bacterium]
MTDFTQVLLGTIVALLPIVNPFSVAITFISLSKDMDDSKRNREALLASVYMTIILVIFLVAGVLIMKFFGISLPGIRIAGGIIILSIGFKMLNPEYKDLRAINAESKTGSTDDIAFSPLAVPMLSGPGAIAVTLGMATAAGSTLDYAAESLGILVVAAVTYICLRIAGGVKSLLGEYGVNVLTRILGFILICVGVQFIIVGIYDFMLNEEFSRPVLQMIKEVWNE